MKDKSKDTIRSLDINDVEKYDFVGAVILYEIRFWLRFNLKEKKNVHLGRVWTFHTMKTLAEKFNIDELRVKRTIKKLREDGILLVDSFNKKKYDKTNWYSIKEDEFITDVDEATAYDNVKTLDRSINVIPDRSINVIPLEYQNDTNNSIKVIQPIPDTNQDNNKNTTLPDTTDQDTTRKITKKYNSYAEAFSDGLSAEEYMELL